MSEFVYHAPVPTLRNRIQYITIQAAEGQYAGKSASACGDDLSKVHKFIRKVASQHTLGYRKCDVAIFFDTGWGFTTRFDIKHASMVSDLLKQIDAEGLYYTGTVPSHMSQEAYDAFAPYRKQDKIDGFTKLLSTPQFNR